MTLAPGTIRRLVRLLRELDAGLSTPEQSDVRALLALLKPRKRIKQKLSEPSRKDARVGKRANRAQRVRVIVEEVMARAGGRCELCGGQEHAGNGLELHHLRPGSGRRRAEESPQTCVAAHMLCHRAWHGGQRDWPAIPDGVTP